MWLVGREDTFWDYVPGPRYRATWPFAKLHATREQLTISAPMIGTNEIRETQTRRPAAHHSAGRD